MAVTGTSHLTKPNSAFEAQSALTVKGMFHFAVPGGPACGTCIFFGPEKRSPSATKRHRCRKCWRTGAKVKAGFYGTQVGCKYHQSRPQKPEKVKRVRKAKVAA